MMIDQEKLKKFAENAGKYVSMANITIPVNLPSIGIAGTSMVRNFYKNKAVEYRKVLGISEDTGLVKLGPAMVLDRSTGQVVFWSLSEMHVPMNAIGGYALLYDSVRDMLDNFFNDREYFVGGKVL